jgi:spore coat polysaccharide biosynthesis predicted glycosyltransferase SpsG/RimJ/RimL family protein N-acetyltransferase
MSETDRSATDRRPSLVVRAEAGPDDGAGHVARGFALGQAWRDQGGSVTLVADEVPALWRGRAADEDIEVVAVGDARAGAVRAPDWVMVDGYRFDAAEHANWRTASRVLVVDDHAVAGSWDVDLVLDQNLGATAASYPGLDAPILLGPRYALLRREFRLDVAPERPRIGGRVALLAGGRPTSAVVAVFAKVGELLSAAGLEPVTVEGRPSLVEAVSGVALAVSAAGGTAWELCALGIAAVLVPVAPNQEPVAHRLQQAGAARAVPTMDAEAIAAAAAALAEDDQARAEMGVRARSLVDGFGAVRLATRLRSELLDLRRAEPGDAELLWAWANDPLTRAQSFSSEPIPWETHLAWFRERCEDPAHALFVAGDRGGPVGLVRFAPAGSDLEIAVVVAPERRGQHLAAPLIDAGVRRVARERGPATVVARIKVGNTASQRAFRAADFDADAEQPGQPDGWLRYTRARHGS